MEAPTKGIVSWWSPDLAGGGEAAADVPDVRVEVGQDRSSNVAACKPMACSSLTIRSSLCMFRFQSSRRAACAGVRETLTVFPATFRVHMQYGPRSFGGSALHRHVGVPHRKWRSAILPRSTRPMSESLADRVRWRCSRRWSEDSSDATEIFGIFVAFSIAVVYILLLWKATNFHQRFQQFSRPPSRRL